MSLFLDSNNVISIRRKDSGIIRLVFDQEDMTNVKVTFAVKVNKYDDDDDAVIVKTYTCGTDQTVLPNEAYFFITPSDTEDLEITPEKDRNDFQEYYWMVKIETNNGLLADTVVPSGTMSFPKFRVYYGSVPNPNVPNTLSIML